MKKCKAMLVGAALLAVPAAGLANPGNMVVNYDFQDSDFGLGPVNMSAGAAGTSGTSWNAGLYPNWWTQWGLVEENGAFTDVGVWGEGVGHWDNDASNNPDPDDELMTDFGYGWDPTERFTIYSDKASTGGVNTDWWMDDTMEFDLYIYANGGDGQGGTFEVWDANGSQTLSTTAAGGWDGTYDEGQDYVVFHGLTPKSATGDTQWDIEIFASANDGSPFPEARINGFQLVQVPEPATISMIGLFGAGMLVVRRRCRI